MTPHGSSYLSSSTTNRNGRETMERDNNVDGVSGNNEDDFDPVGADDSNDDDSLGGQRNQERENENEQDMPQADVVVCNGGNDYYNEENNSSGEDNNDNNEDNGNDGGGGNDLSPQNPYLITSLILYEFHRRQRRNATPMEHFLEEDWMNLPPRDGVSTQGLNTDKSGGTPPS